MIRVRTGSRLHFGLFSLPSEHAKPWLNREGQPTLPRRQFGGVGLMIGLPRIELTVETATGWSAEGPLGERALHFGRAYCESKGIAGSFHLRINAASMPHVGLGSGTQLGLAVARAIAELTAQSERDAVTLARNVGRGLRSALGVHGFEQGGFLVEGGKVSELSISPLLFRCDFPEDWRILLVRPKELIGTHGRREIDAFSELANQAPDDRGTDSLCRLAMLGMMPALLERDFDSFGEAVYDFNRRAGEIFVHAQGGVYAHPRVAEIVRALRGFGVKGVGQTSWGPTVFAIVAADNIAEVRERLKNKCEIPEDELLITTAYNHGAIPRHKVLMT